MPSPIISLTASKDPTVVQPLLALMRSTNNKLPNNSLPTDTEGTIQQNADREAIKDVTLYNSHGIIVGSNSNSLIAYI